MNYIKKQEVDALGVGAILTRRLVSGSPKHGSTIELIEFNGFLNGKAIPTGRRILCKVVSAKEPIYTLSGPIKGVPFQQKTGEWKFKILEIK